MSNTNPPTQLTKDLERVMGVFRYKGCLVRKEVEGYCIWGIKTLTLAGVDQIIANAGNAIVSKIAPN
jgi:hypothetical protein